MSNHLELAKLLIRRDEALRLKAYDDATGEPLRPGMTLEGHPTIGYGRALDVKGISETEAEGLLERDVREAEQAAMAFAGDAWQQLGQLRRAALMSMAHNLGGRGLNGFVQFRLALVAGDFDTAAREMLDSLWADQVGHRARRLATIMRSART